MLVNMVTMDNAVDNYVDICFFEVQTVVKIQI